MTERVPIQLNGEPREVLDGQALAGLLEELGLRTEQVAVERNGQLVPRASHAETRLAAGDRLEIVTLVGGG